MEITSEIEQRVVAQYLGCECLAKIPSVKVKQRIIVDGDLLSKNGQKFFKEVQLILKPLSAITEMQMYKLFEIAIRSVIDYVPGVQHKFFGCDDSNSVIGLKVIDREDDKKYGFSFDGKNFTLTMDGSELMVNQAHLFFEVINMGIDLPIVDGKTLHECGLCIYE